VTNPPLALLARAGVLLAVGVGVGAVFNAVRTDGLRPSTFAAATTCTTGALATEIQVLPPAQAVRLCGDPGVVIADVRAADRFAAGHVAGAIHLPCASTGEAATGALAKVGGAHTVVVYGDSTEQARPVAQSLRQRLPGRAARLVVQVIVIDGGFPAWDRAGLACSSGPCPDCREQARNQP
jgi:rhodanese-related sulfurtransferase